MNTKKNLNENEIRPINLVKRLQPFLKKDIKLKKKIFFKTIYNDELLVDNFQEFLVQNRLSFHMLVVAKLNQKNV